MLHISLRCKVLLTNLTMSRRMNLLHVCVMYLQDDSNYPVYLQMR